MDPFPGNKISLSSHNPLDESIEDKNNAALSLVRLYIYIYIWLWYTQFFIVACASFFLFMYSIILNMLWYDVIWLTLFSRIHDNVMKWKHFPRYWPFVWGIHRSLVNSSHKGQWHGALILSLICAWTNGSAIDNREAGDLRRHRIHYDVTVMASTGTGTYQPWRIWIKLTIIYSQQNTTKRDPCSFFLGCTAEQYPMTNFSTWHKT